MVIFQMPHLYLRTFFSLKLPPLVITVDKTIYTMSFKVRLGGVIIFYGRERESYHLSLTSMKRQTRFRTGCVRIELRLDDNCFLAM